MGGKTGNGAHEPGFLDFSLLILLLRGGGLLLVNLNYYILVELCLEGRDITRLFPTLGHITIDFIQTQRISLSSFSTSQASVITS